MSEENHFVANDWLIMIAKKARRECGDDDNEDHTDLMLYSSTQ